MSDQDARLARISGDQIVASGSLPDWRSMYLGLEGRFRTGNFATALKFVNAIGSAAEQMNHHPDIDLRYGLVNVRLMSHDAGGKTQRDLDLAAVISGVARELGITAEPSTISRVELALDTWNVEEIRPFWAAALGLVEGAQPDELVDPSGSTPTVWFQQTDQHPEPRQRWHLDVRVPPEMAGARIEAALAAGGVVVADDQAPRFTVLADPQGNMACICTHVGRSD